MPATSREAAQPASRSRRARTHRRRWHRCKEHKSHTCWHATTCRHRSHHARATTPPPPSNPTGTGTTPGTGSGATEQVVTPVPNLDALHLANRFTYGMTPALYAEMQAAGSPGAWFAAQLDPATLPDAVADDTGTWWTSLNLDAATIWTRDRTGVEASWIASANYQRWCLMRRILSRRQVLEAVTEVFENHLHVPVHDDGVFGFRTDYGRLVRSHALGRFDQMLVAATTHPAMGVSLDNATSTKRAPNENLGRELLELHTVGRGVFTEDDVKSSARILTGYRVDTWTSSWRVYYDPASHWTGPVQVLGFGHANAAADGRPVTEAYLTYLAHHPATARRVVRKLAARFVSDDPSPALLDQLAQVYLDHDTAIVPVLRALVAHPEFTASAGAKVRTPCDDVVATYRALDVRVARPTVGDSVANAILWQTADVGQAPFEWPRPDGQPERAAAWTSASRLLASFQAHYSMAVGWWPKRDATYHPLTDWVPLTGTRSMRFDALVDHLARRLLARPASAALVESACLATGLAASAPITLTSSLVRWGMPVLLTTLLDSPDHLTR